MGNEMDISNGSAVTVCVLKLRLWPTRLTPLLPDQPILYRSIATIKALSADFYADFISQSGKLRKPSPSASLHPILTGPPE
jgi:hypothetical protein